jgi:hypothetical protein
MQFSMQQRSSAPLSAPGGRSSGAEMGSRRCAGAAAAPRRRAARPPARAASPVTSLAQQQDDAAASTSASTSISTQQQQRQQQQGGQLSGRVARFRATKQAVQSVRELDTRSLAEYMALPASQYSVLDARKVRFACWMT